MIKYVLFFVSLVAVLAIANEVNRYFLVKIPYENVTEICEMVELKSDINNAVAAAKKKGYKVDFDGQNAVIEVQSCVCVIGLPHNDYKGVSACRG